MTPRPPAALCGLSRLLLGNAVILIALLVAIEGLLSGLLLAWDMARERTIAERQHTTYDRELGWVNIPNVDIPDMYGPGVFLTTNRQGFRGRREFEREAPPAKRRVICSGNSVTFGYGVDDDHTWCALLESLDVRLETVNMGQGGYGADQAYLWYKREGGSVRHHVHLFAPITEDFRRMERDTFLGYGKPRLELENGELSVKNVPVPMRSYIWPWVTESIEHLGSLRTAVAIRRLHRRFTGMPSDSGSAIQKDSSQRTAALVYKVLEDLKRLNAQRSSELVLIYLPTLYDPPAALEFWSAALAQHTSTLEIPFVNLVEAFKHLPDDEAEQLYLPDRGHFNARGNEYVAKLIHRRLKSIPRVSQVLSIDLRR
jgi:hypothetical protein